MKQPNICGQCSEEFETRKKYLDHQCKVTGATPKDPASMGKNHEAISEAALARGAARKK